MATLSGLAMFRRRLLRSAYSYTTSSEQACPPKVAVVLSGCGVYDGSEIHEAASVLSHVTRNGGLADCFAPEGDQKDVINHLSCSPDPSSRRNILEESARIARGKVSPLNQLITNHHNYQALLFPGGFGVAKNLSDFGEKGEHMSVISEVSEVIRRFHEAKKPMGFACISPILAAKVICGVTITLGRKGGDCGNKWPHSDAILRAKILGAVIEELDVTQVSVDKENNVFSTPAYMYDGLYHQIDDGIGLMVKHIMTLVKHVHSN